jgi:dipeptidyl aminopeptidase/acylaminoacyl peptidase
VVPEDLLRFVHVSDARVSPDGRRIAFVRKHAGEKNEYVTNIWMVDVAGGEPRQFTAGGKDTHPRWSCSGDRIAFIGAREKHRPQVFVMGAGGGEAVALTSFPEGSIGTFKWSPDGRTLAVSFREQDPDWTEDARKKRKEQGLSDPPRVIEDVWYRLDGDGYFNGQRYRLYVVDASTGTHREVFGRDALGTFSFDYSPDSSKLVVATNRDPRALFKDWSDELLIVDAATGRTSKVPGLPRGPKAAVAWSPAGDLIAWAGRGGDTGDDAYSTENLELWVCDPGGHDARSLTGGEDYCLLAVTLTDIAEAGFGPRFCWGPDGKRLFMQIGWHGECHVASVAARGGRVAFHTSGEAVHQLGNVCADGTTIAMTRATPSSLDEVCAARLSGEGLEVSSLSSFNSKLLAGRRLAAVESHEVTAADGTAVQTWVMKPPGFSRSKRYPAVLEVHGGPHAQYGVGFFHEFQVLASAGYVVVFSNPRGSKGYGRDHCAAIRGRWGGPDWTDLQAVIGFMKALPYVDAARLGVMGGSYGGYLTNWAIGHCGDFAAAITDRCVSNLLSMAGTSDYPDRPDHYWEGNAWDRPEARWEQSPIRYFGNVRTPTLIIHSEGDLRCNVEQAEQVFTTLQALGVPTRFVRYPASTSHGLSRGGPADLRIHRLNQILSWWGQHLRGGVPATEERS